jgi:hypothetical protein
MILDGENIRDTLGINSSGILILLAVHEAFESHVSILNDHVD